MRVLVTGAAGFIGSHTVDLLLASGHEVFGIDNLRTGRISSLKEALSSSLFRLEEADITASGTLEKLVEKSRPEALIHLAGLVSVTESIAHPELNYALNVQATHLVAEVARKAAISRIVFSSSAAVYGDAGQQPIREDVVKQPLSPYGWSKLISESLLFSAAQSYGLTAICLRYFNVYGPRQDPNSSYSGVLSIFSRRATLGKPLFLFGGGKQTRDFIHVEDIGKANVLAATGQGPASGAYNICTGVAVSLSKVVSLLRKRCPSLQVEERPARPADIVHSCGDPTLAHRQLGFRSSIALDSGFAGNHFPA